MKVARWRWWIHFILIGGYFLPGLVSAIYFIPDHPALRSDTRGLLFVAAFNLSIFAVVFFLGWLASRATSEELFLPWRPGWWVVPLGVLYSVAIRVGLALIGFCVILFFVLTKLANADSVQNLVLQNRPKFDRMVDLSALETNRVYYWLTITLISFVVGGLREELWRAGTLAGMRAIWPRAFASRTGEVVAIVLIAIGFGAAHLTMGMIAAVAAGILGVFLGLILLVHRSIWPAVIAHGLFDATSFALLPLVASKLG